MKNKFTVIVYYTSGKTAAFDAVDIGEANMLAQDMLALGNVQIAFVVDAQGLNTITYRKTYSE